MEKAYGNFIIEYILWNILLTIKMLDDDDIRDEQVRWEYVKYEIRKFAIRLSKNLSKEVRKVKHSESSVTNYHNNLQYIEHKERLNTIYSKKVNGIQM